MSGDGGAFQAELVPVGRGGPGSVPTAGCLGRAAVGGQVVQVQADDAVIGGQGDQLDPLEDPAVIHSLRRARIVVAGQRSSAV